MRSVARVASVVLAVVLVAACGMPVDSEQDPTASTTGTTTPLDPPDEAAVEIVSATACKQSDPWTMVETAFEGTVTAIEPRINEDRQTIAEETRVTLGEETWQWVTFEVSSWYTQDYGVEFSMWAPNFEGEIGETWLIGGALYGSLGQQSGEVFPCVTEPVSNQARQTWADRFGAPVAAGSDVPENDPDPALVAEIEEHQEQWRAAGIDDYTAVLSVYQGSYSADECGKDTVLRVLVVDGLVIGATDIARYCEVTDLSSVPVVDDLFELALANAGAITDPISYDQELGYIQNFRAYDRSVDIGASVEVFLPRVMEAMIGTEQSLAAADAALAAWNASGIDDYAYTLDVICFCTISGRFQVTVNEGEVIEVTSAETGPVDLESPDNFMTYDVEGLFALIDDWGGGQAPDNMLASFDPDIGYPVEIRIDSLTNAIDDELAFFVTDFVAN